MLKEKGASKRICQPSNQTKPTNLHNNIVVSIKNLKQNKKEERKKEKKDGKKWKN